MITLFTIAGREARIFTLPNRPQFMLAADLAELYGTVPRRLGEVVKRRADWFPDDFCFRLTEAEETERWSQIATTSPGKRTDLRPLVFTHAGSLMLSAVLHTQVAAKVSVEIHRAFAAMEAKAMRDASLMLSKLQCDVLVKKPIYMRILAAAKSNMTFDQLWRSTNYARHKLETAMAEMVALGILAAPLSSQQSDLFSEG